MKRILFLSLAMSFYSSVNAQFFTQNFSSSTDVADYVTVVPSSGRFDAITQSAAAGTNGSLITSITAGNLRFNRPNPTSEGVTNCAAVSFYRNFGLTTKPTFVKFSFDFELSGTTATSLPGGNAINIQLGNSFTASAGTYATRIGIASGANQGEYKVTTVDNVNSVGVPSSVVLTGKNTITFIVNNTASAQEYTAPDLSNEPIAAGTMEFWIGTTKVTNDYPIKTPENAIDGFKFSAASTHKFFGILDFDNIEMTDLLGGTTLSTSKFENSVTNVMASPNPTDGAFQINNLPLTLETIKLGLYSIDSKLLGSKSYNVNNGSVALDISGLAKGIYFVKGDSNNPLVVKVIKK